MTHGQPIWCAVAAFGLWIGLASPVAATDKSGVKANTISLPSGPGSIEGLGDSFEPALNTGTAKYGLNIVVPPGTAGHAPSVGLSYEGGRGNGSLGFGWGLGMPYVQRQTDKGIPRYVDAPNKVDDDADGTTDEVDELDQFVTDSGEELVPVAPAADGYFFCENESAFIRYRRVPGTCSATSTQTCIADSECPDAETCSGFHWEGTLPDGTRQEFGVNPQARITDAETGHVFKWLLERSTDTNGNTILYRYRAFDGPGNLNQQYLAGIVYGPGQPRAEAVPWDNFHFIAFEYEARPDWFEDGRAGFLCRTGLRLRAIVVGTQGPTLERHASGDFNGDGTTDFLNRRYELEYDADPHWSLLTMVTLIGADGVNPLPPMRLSYTTASPLDTVSAAGASIASQNLPLQVMDNPYVDLVDLNGDALPDMLKTDAFGGVHTAYLNEGETDGAITWASGTDVGGDERAWQIDLAAQVGPIAQLADMNGDGLADFTYKSAIGDVYYFPNAADVTWGPRVPMNIDPSESAPPSPFGSADVKTADIDFDKRMDIVQSVSVGAGANYRVWFNRGGGQYARSVTISPDCDDFERCPGFMLSAPGVHIADVNGDRVPDLARLRPTELQVTAGVGHGRFMPIVSVSVPDYTFDSEQVGKAKLEDITGDGLVDLVLERAVPGELWYWINLGNYTLEHRRVVTDMPAQLGTDPEIRWADMNGNGTTDLVYADQSAESRLQIFDIGRAIGWEPTPKQLTLIDNGLGRRIAIEYRSATAFALDARAAGNPWQTNSPIPLQVVSRVVVTPGLELDGKPGKDTYITDFLYRDPFYDGSEKEFRGFAFVKKIERGDPECATNPQGEDCSTPTQVTRITFHTGAADGVDNDGDQDVDERTEKGGAEEESLKGRILRQEVTTAGGGADSSSGDGQDAPDETVFHREMSDWHIRELHNPSGGTRRIATIDERHVAFAFSGEDITAVIELANGPPQMLRTTSDYDDFGNLTAERDYGALSRDDDQRFTLTEYLHDTALWIVDKRAHSMVTDADGTKISEMRVYYDGPPFIGLPEGQVTRGNVMREELWVGSNEYIDKVRNEYDEFGNVVAVLDPLGDPRNLTVGHRRDIAYEAAFRTFPAVETIHVGADKEPLVMRVEYDVGFAIIAEGLDFNDNRTLFGYDSFARLTSIIRPGDSAIAPTLIFTYAMADPERMVLFRYDQDGALERVAGLQTASSVTTHARETAGEPGTFDTVQYVDGLGRKLALVEEAESGFVVKEAVQFDTRQNTRRIFQPYPAESAIYAAGPPPAPKIAMRYDASGREVLRVNPPDSDGGLSEAATIYGPLFNTMLDELRNERIFVHDGLDRLAEVQEVNEGERYHTHYSYNPADSLVRVVDAHENVKSFAYDGLQRRTVVSDPDRGTMSLDYDRASNLIQTTDAKGQRVVYTYDGINRLTAEDYLDEGLPVSANRSPDVAYHYDDPAGQIDVGDGATRVAARTKGLLAWISDVSGEEHTSYDARGRPTWVVKRVRDPMTGGLTSYKTEMAYDSLDRVSHLVYPDNDRIRYKYNSRKLIERIEGGPSGHIISDLDYTPSGEIARCKYGNGVVSDYGYDPRLRLITLDTVKGQESPRQLLSYRYTFDRASNIRRIDDGRPFDALVDRPRNSQVFEYDDLYRLTHVQYSLGGSDGGFKNDGEITYRYDRLGNLLSQNATFNHSEGGLEAVNLGTLSYGGASGSSKRQGRIPGGSPGPHAPTMVGDGSQIREYTYDDNGNMTSMDGKIFTWDFDDRLVAVHGSQARAEYVYDFSNRRILKRVTTSSPGSSAAESRTTNTIYVSKYFEVRSDKQVVKYVFSGDTRVARITGTLDPEALRVQRLRVTRGWNLLSLSVEADDAAAQLGVGAGVEVYRWDSRSSGFEPIGIDDALPAGSVFWLRAQNDMTLAVTGVPSEPTSVSTPSGAGFLALPGFEPVRFGPALPVEMMRLWIYDSLRGGWNGQFGGAPSFLSSTIEFVGPGESVFVESASSTELLLPDAAARIQYYHQDHVGSSNARTDANGNLVEEAVFYPFGLPRVRTEDAVRAKAFLAEPYLYAEKELDSESGLQYFNARYYAAHLGVFLSPDPGSRMFQAEDAPQHFNSYRYAVNNPLSLDDDSGLGARDFAARLWNKASSTVKAGLTYYDRSAAEAHDLIERAGAALVSNDGGPLYLGYAVAAPLALAQGFVPKNAGDAAFEIVTIAVKPASLAGKVVKELATGLGKTMYTEGVNSAGIAKGLLVGMLRAKVGAAGYGIKNVVDKKLRGMSERFFEQMGKSRTIREEAAFLREIGMGKYFSKGAAEAERKAQDLLLKASELARPFYTQGWIGRLAGKAGSFDAADKMLKRGAEKGVGALAPGN